MKNIIYDQLQLRELFHIQFLRWLNYAVKTGDYVVKGGTNLRFFFNSFRYSEDMDLDIRGIEVYKLRGIVMDILGERFFQEILKPFGIEKIILPNIITAKQTETTQRFKIHLITPKGEDLFTKVEFSRRGLRGNVIVEPIADSILRRYKLPPLMVPHYDVTSTLAQKIDALGGRRIIQARDIFDLYILTTQSADLKGPNLFSKERLLKAYENVFRIDFVEFRDTVVSYLSIKDQEIYNNLSVWEEIRLKVGNFIQEIGKSYV